MSEFLEELLSSGRRLQGTDGVRGTVDLTEYAYPDAIEAFVAAGRITPAFVELNCRAFARMCLRAKAARPRDPVCFADDGRDFYQNKLLRTAAMKGFAEEGLAVRDMGVAPTPGAVIFAAYTGMRLTCVLTASHNPADQNGLKFFVDGLKLLPEGKLSDLTLTREMIALAQGREDIKRKNTDSRRMSVRRRAEGVDSLLSGRRVFLASALAVLPRVNWAEAAVEVIFDPANGAGTQYGLDLLKKLGIRHRAVNTTPDGANINQGGGVGEIEGTPAFFGHHREAADLRGLPVVKQLILRGRANGAARWTVGMVLDGDADRGYLLVYLPERDSVFVVAGDQLAFILAALDYSRGALPAGGYFVTTVEGDLMAPAAASRSLQLRTRVTCVGDKWLTLPAREGEPIAVAAEESGHVIKTLPVSTAKGGMSYVNTGNGIITVMQAIGGVLSGEYPRDRVIQPFAPGFKQAAYTYNVNREAFQPGSAAWAATEAMLKKMFDAIVARRTPANAPKLVYRREEFPQDPGMLYFALAEDMGETLAAIFVRNSGTERKTSINIRGRLSYFGLFQAMMEKIQRQHLKLLKDPNLPETQLELQLLALLRKHGPQPAKVLLKRLNKHAQPPWSATSLHAVLYGLRKEHRIRPGSPVALVPTE